jgi:hypothetical protein
MSYGQADPTGMASQGQQTAKSGNVINVLAHLFRGLSFIFGISAPPPEQDQRSFVFMWLAIIAVLLAFCGGLYYVILHVHLL